MKITIINQDKAVYKNNKSFNNLSLLTVPSNIHALQWNETQGHIEFNDNTPNEIITELPLWANDCIAEWETANTNELNMLEELNQPIVPDPIVYTDQEKLAFVRLQRDKRLLDCDWTQLSDTPASINKEAWATYRQLLRDLPNQSDLNLDMPNWPLPPSN
jgi:hypothetical protein